MWERFTDRARKVIILADQEARRLNHNEIGTEHILLGLIGEGEGVAAHVLVSLGFTFEDIRQRVEDIFRLGQQAPSGPIPFTPRVRNVLELSLREALQLGHNYVGTEHLLLGLIQEDEDDGDGVAAQILVYFGADLNRIREAVIKVLSGYRGKEPTESGGGGERIPSSSLVLDQFGRNLTQQARQGKLDPVIGREREIERVIRVLCRPVKNNPALIGEPGIGKTAIIEGVAAWIAAGRVPAILENKLIYTLSLTALVAEPRAEFMDRLRGVFDEIRTRNDVILLFEPNSLISVATTDEGAALSTALAGQKRQMICTATPAEYASEWGTGPVGSLFQPIRVYEPSMEQAIEILKGQRERYEARDRVSIADTALHAAVVLADRHIKDRFLPRKAIELIDEASLWLRIRCLGSEATDLPEFNEKIADVRREKESAINAQDFVLAAKLRDTEKQLLAQKAEREKQWKADDFGVVAEVNDEQVAEVVAELLADQDTATVQGRKRAITGSELLADLRATEFSDMFAGSAATMWAIS